MTVSPEYLAGLFDGEGSIGVYRGSEGSGWHLRTQLTQNDSPEARELLEECAAAFGGHVSVLRSPSRRHQGLNWQASADNAAALLVVLLPFLRLKREQALVAIDYQRQPARRRLGGPDVADELKRLKRPKDIEVVMRASADLVQPVRRLTPLGVVKG